MHWLYSLINADAWVILPFAVAAAVEVLIQLGVSVASIVVVLYVDWVEPQAKLWMMSLVVVLEGVMVVVARLV